jgi:DNA polymerase
MVMTPAEPMKAAPALAATPVARMAAGALLDWWRLAGHSILVADSPRAWLRPRPLAETVAPPAAPTPAVGRPPADRPAAAALADIRTHAALRAHVAEGAPAAPFLDGEGRRGLMILGEAPSAEDLRTGRPLSGPAGDLLDRMLAAIGLGRADVFITLLAPRKRTPGPPAEADIAADLPLTLRHIELADVSRLLLLGNIPTQALARVEAPISRVRGQRLDVRAGARTLPALASFNPAYLLRRPAEKALAWRDLLALSKWLAD